MLHLQLALSDLRFSNASGNFSPIEQIHVCWENKIKQKTHDSFRLRREKIIVFKILFGPICNASLLNYIRVKNSSLPFDGSTCT